MNHSVWSVNQINWFIEKNCLKIWIVYWSNSLKFLNYPSHTGSQINNIHFSLYLKKKLLKIASVKLKLEQNLYWLHYGTYRNWNDWNIALTCLIKHERREQCFISQFTIPFIGTIKLKTFWNWSSWNLLLTSICFTKLWSEILYWKLSHDLQKPRATLRLRHAWEWSAPDRSHGPGSLTIHIYRAAAHTLLPTHGRHISPHSSDTPSGHTVWRRKEVWNSG